MVGANASGGYGGFYNGKTGFSDGYFASTGRYGAIPERTMNYPDVPSWNENNFVFGEFAGVGQGLWLSNADCVESLSGASDTTSFNVGWPFTVDTPFKVSVQVAGDHKGTWLLSATVGAGAGATFSHYQTDTPVTGQLLSRLF
jgi:hypothetical protein